MWQIKAEERDSPNVKESYDQKSGSPASVKGAFHASCYPDHLGNGH